MFLQNFKTFQVYSSLLIRFIAVFLNVISKLFKFTVHVSNYSLVLIEQIFQNFSSLQFIAKSNRKRIRYSISKLFKFTVHLAQPEGSDYYDIFQNFSSLQFIKLSLYDYKTNNKFQNFSSLQFINEEMTGGDFWI